MVDNDKDTWYPYLNTLQKSQRSFKGIVIHDFTPDLLLLETGDKVLFENTDFIRLS